MQPSVLKSFTANGRNSDGFLDRFLFVYPKKLKPDLFTGQSIPDHMTGNYHKLIENLLKAPETCLQATQEAIDTYTVWQHNNAKKYFHDTEERSVQAKMETYVWRNALVLEMMYQAEQLQWKNELSAVSVDRAIILTEYFRENAFKVRDILLDGNPLQSLSAKQRDLFETLPFEFERQTAVELFLRHGLSAPTADRFLKKKELFFSSRNDKNLSPGQYRKKNLS